MANPPLPPAAPGPPPPQPRPAGGAARPAADPNAITSADIGLDAFAAPFANSGIQVDEFGPRWWFEYFWHEAASVKKSPNIANPMTDNTRALVDVANLIFTKEKQVDKDGRPVPGKITLKVKPELSLAGADATWRTALIALLRIGFRAVPKAGAVPAGAAPIEIEPNAMTHSIGTRHLGKEIRSWKDIKQPDSVPVYWRSETRSYQMIVAQQGTKRQIDVDTIARDLGMTAPWHPYSAPEISKYMWYRLANADNDYYTVISIATDMLTALGFPKVDEARVYKFPQKDPEEWTKTEARTHRASLGVATVNGKQQVVVISRTTAYMLVHYGSMLDTQGASKTRGKDVFTEMGVEHIPLDNIFGVFPMRRVHHGPKPGDGITCFLDIKDCVPIRNTAQQTDYFGQGLYTRLDEVFRKARYGGPYVTAWGKTGAKMPDKPMNVTMINEFPISDWPLTQFIAKLKA